MMSMECVSAPPLTKNQHPCKRITNISRKITLRFTNMNSFQEAIAQANRSCSLVEAGLYDAAIDQLSSTLLSTMKIIMTQANEERSLETSLDQCMKTRSSSMSIDEEMQGQFLYKRAILIPTDLEMSYRELVMVSCMITFNLAIAYHQRGDTESLARAMKLYELSYNLQRDQQLDNNILFTLAIVNNLGLVHRQLNDELAAGECFDHVLSTLMYLTCCGQASESHLDGFFYNVTGAASQPSVAPAA